MQETRICLIRHGETSWNTQRRWQGHENIPLNAHGLLQAKAAGRALSKEKFAAIYHSDLDRAANTAHIIAKVSMAPLFPEPELRERHFGAIQGLTREEAAQHYPDFSEHIHSRKASAEPPGQGGESLERFAGRIGAVFGKIASRHAGQQILIVSHGGCMDVMYRIVTGLPLEAPRTFALGNATLNWVSWREGQWQLHEWDKNTHLAGVLDEISA
jgi:probable phosphoglycerate mutase